MMAQMTIVEYQILKKVYLVFSFVTYLLQVENKNKYKQAMCSSFFTPQLFVVLIQDFIWM